MFSSIPASERVAIIKNLATMARAGLPIDEMLKIIAEETSYKSVRQAFNDIVKRVQGGEALAKALADHTDLFDEFFVRMVSVGEKSGILEQNLEYLALRYQKDEEVRGKVKEAMTYPIIVICIASAIGFGYTYWVIPQLTDLFTSSNIILPLSTKILLGFSNILQQHIGKLSAGLLILGIGVYLFLHLSKVRPYWHRVILYMPIVGQLSRELNLARLTRTMGILLKGGFTIIDALETAAKSLNNEVYRQILQRVAIKVQHGEGMALALQNVPKSIMPLMVTRMISIGEHTAKLDEMMLYLGELYEQSVDKTTSNLSTILGPLLLVIIGAVVVFLVLAILTPIYQISNSF